MKKKLLLALVIILIIFPLFISTREFKERTSQECGKPMEVNERVHWVWQWWPSRDDDKGFIACIGPSHFITYRPLDIAGLGFMLSIGLVIFAKKNL